MKKTTGLKAALTRRFLIISCLTFLCVTVFCLSGCQRIKDAYSKLSGEEEPPVAAAPVFAVNTTPAVTGQIRDYLMLSGDISAVSTVDAYSDAAGKVSRLFVSTGSRVSRGEVIAKVDPSRPGMEYVESDVKAPISGTVVALPAQLGMTISQAVPLARISGSASGGLEIRLHVSERFISRVSPGQICEITLDAWPGEVFRGRISEISPTVDPASRTMETKVAVENSDSKLKAGMFAKVKIITEQKDNVVKIPQSALIRRFGEEYLFIAEADPAEAGSFVARKKIVAPGIMIDGVMEVKEGLSADDEVIIQGQSLLEDGVKVNIIDRTAPLN
jgi:multidrug efflux pump subunit AcrA (membrane-fusion protein)